MQILSDKDLGGKSIATEGAASIRGVPALGFPKMTNRVGFIFIPALSASPVKSIVAKTRSPLDFMADSNLANVSSKEWALAMRAIPFSDIVGLGPFCHFLQRERAVPNVQFVDLVHVQPYPEHIVLGLGKCHDDLRIP